MADNIITPPEGYRDRMPRRGPWLAPVPPPAEAETVETIHAGGETESATWINGGWWTWHGDTHPIGWRRIEDNRITAAPGSGEG